jgi:hypothetical protein
LRCLDACSLSRNNANERSHDLHMRWAHPYFHPYFSTINHVCEGTPTMCGVLARILGLSCYSRASPGNMEKR